MWWSWPHCCSRPVDKGLKGRRAHYMIAGQGERTSRTARTASIGLAPGRAHHKRCLQGPMPIRHWLRPQRPMSKPPQPLGPPYGSESAVCFAPWTTLRYGMGPERTRRPYERADGDQASHITRSIHGPPNSVDRPSATCTAIGRLVAGPCVRPCSTRAT